MEEIKVLRNLDSIKKFDLDRIIQYIKSNINEHSKEGYQIYNIKNRWLFGFYEYIHEYFWLIKISNNKCFFNKKENRFENVDFMYFNYMNIELRMNSILYNVDELNYIVPNNILDYRINQIYNLVKNNGK